MPVSIAYIFSASDYRRYFIDRFESHLNSLRGSIVSSIYTRSVDSDVQIDTIAPFLEQADIVLVFVSPEFSNTAYFQHGSEIRRITARYQQANGNMEVIPILLNSSNLRDTPLPNVSPLPRKGPVALQVSTMLSPDSNSYSEVYSDVVRDIKEIAIGLNARRVVRSTTQSFPFGWILGLLSFIAVAVLAFFGARAVQPPRIKPEPSISPSIPIDPKDPRTLPPTLPPEVPPISPFW